MKACKINIKNQKLKIKNKFHESGFLFNKIYDIIETEYIIINLVLWHTLKILINTDMTE